MPSFEYVSEFMFNNLIKTSVNGTSFIARCPYCGDSKKSTTKRRFHLKFINEDIIVFNCFNCPATGHFVDLYAFINGIDTRQAYKELRNKSLDSLRNRFKKTEVCEIEKPSIEYNEFSSILVNCLDLQSTISGYVQLQYFNILQKFYNIRKIDETFKLYIAYKGEWKNRIIIPIYENNKLIYFQGRAINDTMQPKYKNPIAEKKQIIFNKNNFEKDKYIIITEGILDSLSIGNQGTVCLGAHIADEFIDRVYEYTNVGIIVALDNDETGKNSTLSILSASRFKNSLKYFVMPKKFKHIKDLNELKVNSDINNLYDFVIDNSYSMLQSKILLKCL